MIKFTEEREIAPMRGYIRRHEVSPPVHVDRLFCTKLFQAVLANIRQDRQDTASNVDSNDLR
jgi:hypothetical protein